jgi:TonB-dependent receptor
MTKQCSLRWHRRTMLLGASMLAALPVAALAQTAPTPSAQASQDATTVEEIIVTGFRGSLIQATNAKRESTGFTDSIFAEDIGKFPDTNLAESLNRIPGVQLTREINGEGLNISVRGLGTNFTKVLLNSAQISVASSGRTDSQNQNREVDLDLFPTELFTRLDVNKTPMASTVEGGVAGVVNMRSARPFDREGRSLTYSVQGNYGTISEEFSPRVALIGSQTWDLAGGGQFGALLGIASVRNKSRTEGFETIGWTNANLTDAQCGAGTPAGGTGNPCNQPFGGNGFNIPGTVPVNAGNGLIAGTVIDAAFLQARNPGTSLAALGNGLLPRLGRDSLSEGSRDRDSALLSLEYRPSDSLHFYADILYGHADREFQRTDMNWVVRNSNAMVPLGVTVDSNNVVTGGTFANSQFFLEARPYHEILDFYNVNPGVMWQPTDWLRIDGQFNYSKSEFERHAPTILFNTPLNTGLTVTFDNSGDFPTIASNRDLNDPNLGWVWAGGRVNVQNEYRDTETKGTRWDFTVGRDEGINVRFGAAYDDVSRTIDARDNSQRWQNFVCGGGGAGSGPTDTLPTTNPSCDGRAGSAITQANLASYIRQGELGFVTIDFDRFFKDTNYDAYDSAAPSVSSAATGASSGTIGERTTGAYIEINGITSVLDRDLRFNAGVRYATTDQEITGPQTINGVTSFLTLAQTYDEYLPAFNAVWEVVPNVNLRLAASRTLTRPNPSAMLPGTTFSDPSAQSANQGNPSLAPYLSNNFDFGGEWYTGHGGYFGVALFTKSITGFTVQGTNTIPFNQLGVAFDSLTTLQQQAITNRGGPNVATVTVTQQVNANGVLDIEGMELTWVQPLDFLLDGLGFTANYTKINQSGSGTGAPAVAVGISPTTYAATGYYEHGPVSFRLSYVWNDAQISSGPNQNSVPVAQIRTDARGQLDMQASWTFENLPSQPRLTLDVQNLLDEPQRQTFEYDNAAFTYYDPGVNILVGIRGRF